MKKNTELVKERPVVWQEKPPFPHNMLMELTNYCNLQCVFCGYKSMKRKKSFCEKSFMLDIMKQAYENGTREIGFYRFGEPLISKDLPEYVMHARDLGYEYIYLTTNGVLADLDCLANLIESGLNSIKFSINAATREHYQAIHGADKFLAVKANVEALSEYLQKNNIDLPVFISFVKNEINKDDVDLLYEIFDDLVDRIYIYDCVNFAGKMSELVTDGTVKQEDLQPGGKIPCEMIFNRLHITCEGYLNACCEDTDGYLSAVDLHKMTLLEAWNSEVMVDLRRQHLCGKLKPTLCSQCVHNTCEKIVPLNPELLF